MIVLTNDGKHWAVADDPIEINEGVLSFMSSSGDLKEFPVSDVLRIYSDEAATATV